MRCGFGTLGFSCQIHGHPHGVPRYASEMSQSVSPRATVWMCPVRPCSSVPTGPIVTVCRAGGAAGAADDAGAAVGPAFAGFALDSAPLAAAASSGAAGGAGASRAAVVLG